MEKIKKMKKSRGPRRRRMECADESNLDGDPISMEMKGRPGL